MGPKFNKSWVFTSAKVFSFSSFSATTAKVSSAALGRLSPLILPAGRRRIPALAFAFAILLGGIFTVSLASCCRSPVLLDWSLPCLCCVSTWDGPTQLGDPANLLLYAEGADSQVHVALGWIGFEAARLVPGVFYSSFSYLALGPFHG